MIFSSLWFLYGIYTTIPIKKKKESDGRGGKRREEEKGHVEFTFFGKNEKRKEKRVIGRGKNKREGKGPIKEDAVREMEFQFMYAGRWSFKCVKAKNYSVILYIIVVNPQ